ncbi:hypothetical protein [Legionella resiliens]|uniref:Substrate of the Dot/Icm secretion system n=1 Tax=Legionella resiliens TaxID=2905958 RepID=A0ABS8X1Q2_9GAMM|nr:MULTISPECIES: hypothetical protein [unclassified Legionella]MCE0721725.1 hypothetical protein [Legionella sp. 9fVS26]MCE3530879.1 hypothetical protein [Legionella sp. 8cVS16]
MKEKIGNIANRLDALGIKQLKPLPQEDAHALMQWAACIDHLNHAAYEAIEAQYSQFNPNASKDEQIIFYKRILAIKNILRELQVVHNDLTKSLQENSALYIPDEATISLNAKYILPELKAKEPKEIVRANFYQLLENISKNNSLSKEEFNYITSLLMQIASRPQGMQLIVKLNYLLTTKNAQLILKPSNNFECSLIQEGRAATSPNYTRKSITPEEDFKTLFKREVLRGAGAKRIPIGVDYRFNDKISSVDLDAYASAGHGLTDGGPAFILLAHELIHGLHNLTGKALYNFSPFFQGPKYEDDPMMQLLYPKNSGFSLGPSAEEYWTIEGGSLCENSIRHEHGFFKRTGHVSAEPGGRALIDLYYIGLARSYEQSDLLTFVNHFENTQTKPDATEDDKVVERLLLLEKYNYFSYSLTDLVELCEYLSPIQLKRIGQLIQKLSAPENPEQTLQEFLMTSPPKSAQLLMAISKSKEINYDEEIDSETLEKALPNIQKLNELFKSSGFPDELVSAFSDFAENMETKSSKSNSFSA